MEWEGDEGYAPLPAWSCETVTMWTKLSSVSHTQSCTFSAQMDCWNSIGMLHIYRTMIQLCAQWKTDAIVFPV
jgi:hypothetical protein